MEIGKNFGVDGIHPAIRLRTLVNHLDEARAANRIGHRTWVSLENAAFPNDATAIGMPSVGVPIFRINYSAGQILFCY